MLGCLLLLLYFPVLTLVRGWAIETIWNWYIPVIFKGAPIMSMAAALGIATLTGMFSSSSSSSSSFFSYPSSKHSKPEGDRSEQISSTVTTFLMPLLMSAGSVFFAWVYRHWL